MSDRDDRDDRNDCVYREDEPQVDAAHSSAARRSRLEALLFTGGPFSSAILALSPGPVPKKPPGCDE